MSRVIVLKFGGSVLRDEHTIGDAAREITRWRAGGNRVVAVVSALQGVTDSLLARARSIVGDPPEGRSGCGHAIAAASAIGEHESAAWLALHLGLLAQPASVLTPAALRLVATGPALDANPVSVDLVPIARALNTHGVAIVPGFAAIDENARPVVLGRGGSDLTALFLTAELINAGHAAACRLVKDVDGLYDRDPKQPGASRLAHATHDDCLRTDGSIIQFKAVRFAESRDLSFELGSIGSGTPTTIGASARPAWSPELERRATTLRNRAAALR